MSSRGGNIALLLVSFIALVSLVTAGYLYWQSQTKVIPPEPGVDKFSCSVDSDCQLVSDSNFCRGLVCSDYSNEDVIAVSGKWASTKSASCPKREPGPHLLCTTNYYKNLEKYKPQCVSNRCQKVSQGEKSETTNSSNF